MKEKLFAKFKKDFITTAVLSFIGVFAITAIWIKAIINYTNYDLFFVLMFSFLEISMFIFSCFVMFPFLYDYKLVKRNQMLIVKGCVCDFSIEQDCTESPSTYYHPIIKDDLSGNKILLKLDELVSLGEHCLIYYLPKTKIAVLVTKSN